MDQVKIGKFIAELRKEKSMTQQQLGDKLGVSFKTKANWNIVISMQNIYRIIWQTENIKILVI